MGSKYEVYQIKMGENSLLKEEIREIFFRPIKNGSEWYPSTESNRDAFLKAGKLVKEYFSNHHNEDGYNQLCASFSDLAEDMDDAWYDAEPTLVFEALLGNIPKEKPSREFNTHFANFYDNLHDGLYDDDDYLKIHLSCCERENMWMKSQYEWVPEFKTSDG